MRCALFENCVLSCCSTSGNLSNFLEMSDPIEFSYNRLLNRNKLHNRKAIIGDQDLCTSGYHGFYAAPVIIFQVALASLLLFACVLLARSFEALENAPLGFNPRGVLVTNIYLPDSKYGTIPQCRAFFDSLPAEQYVPFQTYYPFGQPHPFRTTDSGTLVVRTDGNPGALMPAVQKIVIAMDPDVPVMTR
jgi:hypothetical protein